MKTIAKYVIQPGQQQVMIPSESVLSAGSLKNEIYLYALTNSEDSYQRPYDVRVYETNQDIHDELQGFDFLCTITMADDKVFHIFLKELTSMDF